MDKNYYFNLERIKMADTRADVAVAKGVWVDLYAGSSIAVGTAVDVINKGSHNCVIAISLAAPAATSTGYPLYAGPVGSFASIDASETGLWCYSVDGTTRILVQE